MNASLTTPRLARVRLAVPNAWDDLSMLSFAQPASAGFRRNVVVTVEPQSGASMEAHVDGVVAMLARETVAHRVSARVATTINGLPAVRLQHSFAGEGGARVAQWQAFVAVDDGDPHVVYTVTCTALEADMVDAGVAFDAILASLTIANR